VDGENPSSRGHDVVGVAILSGADDHGKFSDGFGFSGIHKLVIGDIRLALPGWFESSRTSLNFEEAESLAETHCPCRWRVGGGTSG
jgi:hypothetical protein